MNPLPGVVEYLYDHPEGLDPPIDHASTFCAGIKDCKRFHATMAKKGDVIILHGLLPHVSSPNYLHYARTISNPHVALHSPHNFNRPDGDYVRDGSLAPRHALTRCRACWSK